MEVEFDFSEKLKSNNNLVSSSNVLNVGYFFLQQIYHGLNIRSFFQNVTSGSKITFAPDLVNRFLSYARILGPDSKLGTYDHLHAYYEKPGFEYVHILRTIDVLAQHYDEYISYLFEYSANIIKRNTSVCYYDCSNYYFETEAEDEGYVDEVTGETIKGFRKYAISKGHRPNPLVEIPAVTKKIGDNRRYGQSIRDVLYDFQL